ncbi:MAG: terpene synthase [Actinomycetota bacterium]|nr:terpene synthase [Actinomycetota bacterium]
MSLLSRLIAPPAANDLAAEVAALLSNLRGAAPTELTPAAPLSEPVIPPLPLSTEGSGMAAGPPGGPASRAVPLSPIGLGTGAVRLPAPPPPRDLPQPATPPGKPAIRPLPLSPIGLGTAAARLPAPSPPGTAPTRPAPNAGLSGRPAGLGTSAAQVGAESAGGTRVPELYCPGPVRDDEALGEEVNDRLVEWAEQVGIYPGKLDQVRAANVGRLIMLAHPESDDPDRLLAAAKCALAEWATDDHYVDDEMLGADPPQLSTRLVLANAVVDPAHLPNRYAPELERAVGEDPVLVAYRSGLDHLARYASVAQMARLRHELAVMFVAYNQEAAWRATGRTPPVWEYLVHRHENSFLPCMVLIDPVAGYELPPREFADPRVRRVFTMAGSASVLVNDLYSVSKEQSGEDFNLPKLIAAEEGCSLQQAIERTVELHDELMHTVEVEAAALSLEGSPALGRFLAGVWAWLGGGLEWHRTSPRYSGATQRAS